MRYILRYYRTIWTIHVFSKIMLLCEKAEVVFLWLLIPTIVFAQEENRERKQHPELTKLVRNWAQKLGGELWHFGELVTRRTMVIDSFKDTTIVREDGEALLKDIHERISHMMKLKVEAVKRIMDIAEQAAKAQKEDDIDEDFQFYNTKNLTNSAPNYTVNDEEDLQERDTPKLQELKYNDPLISSYNFDERYRSMVQQGETDFQQDDEPSEEGDSFKEDLEGTEEIEITDGSEKDPQASQTPIKDKTRLPFYPNRRFYNIPVNTNFSAVHVPSNVYERSKDVLTGIIWSEELDKTFRNNYKLDPTLSWQYFGSSSGFMRQFPAMQWHEEPLDLYDCRTRSWFIEGASSPKDVIILVDRSGSMTGVRREIAKHVVHNILDTLGNNDYVNIFTFSNTTDPLIDCFDNILVQANMANVRLLAESMTNFKTEQIANFSLALITAFEILKDYRESKQGAGCNQAIMLVTDGVQNNYTDIFEQYNWIKPFVNVRIFTYLIGREVSNVKEVKWMACANQGYFTHLSTYAEVREEVLQYIPVMARPMVLNPNHKPNPTWTPIYADVTDPKLTNWLWINRERNRQRERFLGYRPNKTQISPDVLDKKFVHQQKNKQDNYGDLQVYHMMTSVSLPVYDKKQRKERVANLLGVAGTDVPIEYIQRLMLPYRLGVNGYAFIVTNNGYILTHPDLRPVHQGILKPAYNRVDLTEVELLDDGDADPRTWSEELKEFRKRVVMQRKGNKTFNVKTHLDDMRRIIVNTRHYFYMGLNDTPFGLVIALPGKYGFNRVQHPVENDIHRIRSNDKIKRPFTQFFTGNWTIHPDWHYCRYLDDHHYFETPEQEFLHFLEKMESPGWKWTSECDRKLICKVVADAKITAWFSQNITTTSKEENGPEFIKRFGITVAFLATHSGLTRWQDFPQNIDLNTSEPSNFHLVHNKAIDEVWYRRAVERHYVDPRGFIYSVPFEIGHESNVLVTVSHAIFRDDSNKRAPAAVVGYQFYHSSLYSLFKNITTTCGDMSCTRTCDSKELHCLMVDDNGYVIVSNNVQDTGFFFGQIRPDIMKELLKENIYKVTRVFDYQGICPEGEEVGNPASKLLTPFVHLSTIFHWLLTTAAFFINLAVGEEFNPLFYQTPDPLDDRIEQEQLFVDADPQEDIENHDQPYFKLNEKEFIARYRIQKTKPESCDNEMWIYSLVHYTERNMSNSGYNKTMTDCSRPFIVQRVSGSNMILLVINNLCRANHDETIPWPEPIQYNYNMSATCYKVLYNNLPRRHYMSCINRNINESEIKLCGHGTNLKFSIGLVLLLLTALQLNLEHLQ
ncbi:voltage-dependent calcium channel subunit alpha-2/delta-3-like isoform X2 [Harmonia axyridis]|uniref:voltage-dependent calcium channel subunit alpha-2/delta-3-like isoform X2 n=1 Tax=Harmonia axyridis TaxID=115357 RepID=UPI001E277936|nr:voltage-dependent calcium channel subunit alpha-2/delta-3-like isoform X2 [Harmonia axyridis]